ncbi:hypothetical protein VIGAN_01038900, partial [Vigna angularis var. angularis]
KTRNEAKSSLDSLSICCMYALATSSLPSRGMEDALCLTWSSKSACSLGRRLSTAHFAAYWLVLLFSIATATTRPAPIFFS